MRESTALVVEDLLHMKAYHIGWDERQKELQEIADHVMKLETYLGLHQEILKDFPADPADWLNTEQDRQLFQELREELDGET